MKYKFALCAAPILVAAALGLAPAAHAASTYAVITPGAGAIGTAPIALGVWDYGNLNVGSGITTNGGSSTFNGTSVGGGSLGLAFRFPAAGGLRDATSPGCLCEGWGVSGNGISGYTSVDSGTGFGSPGIHNLSLDSAAFSNGVVSSAVSKTHLTSLPALTVSQDYHLSTSSSLFEDTVTITNTSGATITGVRYTRAMDWDVPPTEFSDMVTNGGVAAALGSPSFGSPKLLCSGDNGFMGPDPLAPCTVGAYTITFPGSLNTDFVRNGPSDHGAVFTFGFGDIPAGKSATFEIYYGAAGSGAGALAALASVGAEVYSLGQCNPASTACGGITYAFGFKGVGGTALVPEPGSLALFGAAMAGLVALRRRKSA